MKVGFLLSTIIKNYMKIIYEKFYLKAFKNLVFMNNLMYIC